MAVFAGTAFKPTLFLNKILRSGSEEFFKPVLLRLAYGTDLRGPLTGAEISANFAPPDGIRKGRENRRFRPAVGFLSFLLGGTPFRDGLESLLSFQERPGNIEGAIAGPVIPQVRVPVIAGADDVQVLALIPGSQSAGTGPVAVSLLVDQEAFDQLLGKGRIRVEVISSRFGFLVQPLE